MVTCPNCRSGQTRRGGNLIWTIYVTLVGVALVAVLLFHLNAAIVGGIMIAIVAITHLVLNRRVCVDCGHQWRG